MAQEERGATMNPNELHQLAKIMHWLGDVYQRPATDGLIDSYEEALEGYSLDHIGRAVKDHFRDPVAGRYYPRPADIIKRIHIELGPEFGSLFRKLSGYQGGELTPFEYYCYQNVDPFRFKRASTDKAEAMLKPVYAEALGRLARGDVFKAMPKAIAKEPEPEKDRDKASEWLDKIRSNLK